MFALSVEQIATACGGTVLGSPQRVVRGISTDSRTVTPGSLFVAIKGERFDGHDHVAAALGGGAVACLVSKPIEGVDGVLVTDTVAGLQRAAQVWRQRFSLPVLALTGSNGKTTVKEMLRTILIAHFGGQAQRVLATEGNLNNHIGVPLMLARLSAAHACAVIEAGMNHFGEIRTLTHLIRPSVALINNAGPAHLEGVGDLDGVARAKGEIFEGLVGSGTAVLNADDAYFEYWRGLLAPGTQLISFGTSPAATVRGTWTEIAESAPMQIACDGQQASVSLPLAGAHHRMNALAATAGAMALGVPLTTSAQALARFEPVQGRQRAITLANGALIIDDTYNANPASVRAAIDVLLTRKGKRVLVLGQLAELGQHSEALHREIGQIVGRSAVDRFFATGERMRVAVDACNALAAKGQWFETKAALAQALRAQLTAETVVLVKGSRSSAMEDVVAALAPDTTTRGH